VEEEKMKREKGSSFHPPVLLVGSLLREKLLDSVFCLFGRFYAFFLSGQGFTLIERENRF
jgi:hypothetical protein